MIVYREQRSRADPRRLVSELRSAIDRAGAGAPSHELVRDLLIDTGVLESGIADSVFREADGMDPLIDRCRVASLAIGRAFWHSWQGDVESTLCWWHRFAGSLGEIERARLPGMIETTNPEGYAYYSLYPEMYLEAAKRCHTALGNFPAVCIGLRSIGSSLSAVVAAALTAMGCEVESFTVRPRGHPCERALRLDARLTARVLSRRQATFLVIDEGPGISGSSIAGTLTMLNELGVPDQRICLFPSWRTDGSQLKSPAARQSWTRHRQFTSSFEEVWLDSGRLAAVFPGQMRDISAGFWREAVYAADSDYPAVQPQHERRKYLLTPGPADAVPGLLRFAGLGRSTRAKVRRAEGLADAGFIPRPERTAHGFVLQPFVPGRPVSVGEPDVELIETAASYLAHLCRKYPSNPAVSDSSLREMIAVNVAEGMSSSSLDHRVLELPFGDWVERPVQLDGRMLAHEWIRTPDGYLKVDAMDHHDDHFLPGCQDIAWDLAATIVELRLDRAAEAHLVDCYRSQSGDQSISRRLLPYSVAYLAFRLGYARLAATVLGQSPDGSRFLSDSRRYARLLTRRLNAGSGSHV